MSDSQLLHLAVEVDGEREGEAYKAAAYDLSSELKKYLPEDALQVPEAEAEADDVDKGLPPGLLNINISVGDALTELARTLRDWLNRNREITIEVSSGVNADGSRKTTVVAKGATEDEIKTALQELAGHGT